MSGRPGGVYLDLPAKLFGQVMDAELGKKSLVKVIDAAPAQIPAPDAIKRALHVLKGAKRPLIILGKGAAYAQADDAITLHNQILNHLLPQIEIRLLLDDELSASQRERVQLLLDSGRTLLVIILTLVILGLVGAAIATVALVTGTVDSQSRPMEVVKSSVVTSLTGSSTKPAVITARAR